MQELLLLFSCVNSIGCAETFGNYKFYNQSMVQNVEYEANKRLEQLPTSFKTYGLPAIALAAGGTGTITVHKNLVLSLSSSRSALVFTIPLN